MGGRPDPPTYKLIRERLDTDFRKQRVLFDEVFIDAARYFAAFGDRPHDERLSTARVTRSEDAGNRRHARVRIGFHIAALIERTADLLQQTVLARSEEAHRQQHEVAFPVLLSTRLFHRFGQVLYTVPTGLSTENSQLSTQNDRVAGFSGRLFLASLIPSPPVYWDHAFLEVKWK